MPSRYKGRKPSESAPDERGLIDRTKAGDVAAFGKLVDRHLPRLRAYLALRVPVPDLIDDLAQETLVYAARHIQEFATGTVFIAWLQAIAGNLLRAQVQRYSREQANRLRYGERLVLETTAARISDRTVDELERLAGCLAELPQSSRALLDMRYTERLSTVELARAARRSMAWVRTTLCRIRKQLLACMTGRAADEEQQ